MMALSFQIRKWSSSMISAKPKQSKTISCSMESIPSASPVVLKPSSSFPAIPITSAIPAKKRNRRRRLSAW
jgi:hypothetical protein